MVTGRARGGVGGFSLVELILAVTLLQIGLLAVAATGWLAARTLADAAQLQRAGGALASVADSIVRDGVAASGERAVPPFLIRWRSDGGVLDLDAVRPADGRVLVRRRVPGPVGMSP